MALERLRRVLQSRYTVRLQSDQQLLDRVNNKIDRRAQEFAAKQKAPPPTKRPTVVAAVQAKPAAVLELDRQLNLNESVLRTKVLRPEER